MASQIIASRLFTQTVCSGADQRKHQSCASLAFVRGIHRWRGIHRSPMNSPLKGPVTRKMFLFEDVIMVHCYPYPSGLLYCHHRKMVSVRFGDTLISLYIDLYDPNENRTGLVQVMEWHRTGDRKQLNQCWSRPMTHLVLLGLNASRNHSMTNEINTKMNWWVSSQRIMT